LDNPLGRFFSSSPDHGSFSFNVFHSTRSMEEIGRILYKLEH
jgi:hypothetical protein